MSIHLHHLESELPEKTRLRGYDYYCEGRVRSVFNINGLEWMAVVQGYDDHVVELRIVNDTVVRYACNCNDEEDPCKHVAAVLYHIRNEAAKTKRNDPSGYDAIKEEVSYLPVHVLRYLILKYAAHSKEFRSFLSDYFKVPPHK